MGSVPRLLASTRYLIIRKVEHWALQDCEWLTLRRRVAQVEGCAQNVLSEDFALLQPVVAREPQLTLRAHAC